MANGPDKSGGKRRRINWKKVLLAAAALVVAGSMAQGVMRSVGGAGNSGSGQRRALAPAKMPERTVTLNGHEVPAGGKPIIILNPGLAAPGSRIGVQGSGFDPGATVRVYLVRSPRSRAGTQVAFARTARDGSVSTQFTMPVNAASNTGTVLAQEGNGKSATAEIDTHGRVGRVSIIGKGAGQPGGAVTISASGFSPGEKVDVFWGRITGPPAARETAGPSGSIGRATVPIGVAPVGPTTLVLIGEKSRTTATAPFQMLGLYPNAKSSPYALKAGNVETYSGGGFAPGERVLIYLNTSGGRPALTAQADSGGRFSISFRVPFGLRGSQRLIAIGDESRASVTSGFDVLPYIPTANASTYGAMPGTTVSFYAKGFAPNEVVLVYTGNPRQLATAFRVDGQGTASAAGRYVVPSNTGPSVTFSLVGQKSGGTANVKLSVSAPNQHVNVPSQRPYRLPPSLGGKPYPSGKHSRGGKSSPAASHSH